jgi:hypothetical protein
MNPDKVFFFLRRARRMATLLWKEYGIITGRKLGVDEMSRHAWDGGKSRWVAT